MKMQTASVGGKSVGYRVEGQGTPVVLLHGWPQTSHLWRKVVPTLAKSHRVVLIDLPGIGASAPAEGWDTQSVSRHLREFLRTQGIDRFHLVGHDVGAWVAASFALHFEKSLRSLTVLDAGIPGLIPDDLFRPENAQRVWQFFFHAVADLPEQLIAGKEKDYLGWYFRTKAVVANALTEEDLDTYVAAYSAPGVMANGFGYYRAFPVSAQQNRAFQGRLALPVLAVGAQAGVGASIGAAMEKVANTTTKVIAGCGHYIPEEQPQAFLDVLVPFLKTVEATQDQRPEEEPS